MKSGYSVELDNFGSGCLRKCELLPAICFLFLFTFVITFLFPFFQFLLFYRSDFIFLKILLLWSALAQSKSPLSKQRFKMYTVVNIDFVSLQRFRECKFESKLLSSRLACRDFFKVHFWVGNRSWGKTVLETSSLKKSTCRQILGWQWNYLWILIVHHSGSHKQSKFSLCTPFLLQVSR